jgi:hypothetical protein
MRIEEVITAPHSPWQFPYVERLIGSIRRGRLNHVIVFNETHLRRILKSYIAYCRRSRTHLSLTKDAPMPRARSARRARAPIPAILIQGRGMTRQRAREKNLPNEPNTIEKSDLRPLSATTCRSAPSKPRQPLGGGLRRGVNIAPSNSIKSTIDFSILLTWARHDQQAPRCVSIWAASLGASSLST